MIVALALIESLVIYGLLIAFNWPARSSPPSYAGG